MVSRRWNTALSTLLIISVQKLSFTQRHLAVKLEICYNGKAKNVNNCLNTDIYSYLVTPGACVIKLFTAVIDYRGN